MQTVYNMRAKLLKRIFFNFFSIKLYTRKEIFENYRFFIFFQTADLSYFDVQYIDRMHV